MNLPYARSEDINSYSGFRPRAWLTNQQLEHSANFTGNETQQQIADAIRDQEQVGSDGMVRTRQGLSLSYSQALEFLGMSNDNLPP